MCKGRWGATVIPVNDAEMLEARKPGPSNLFQRKIQVVTESLQRWLLVYLVAASDASSTYFQLSLPLCWLILVGRGFQPVLLPNAIPVRDGDSGHIRSVYILVIRLYFLFKRLAAAPSVLDAVLALHETLIDLGGLLQVVVVCSNRLENWESIGLEEMEEVSSVPDITTSTLTRP